MLARSGVRVSLGLVLALTGFAGTDNDLALVSAAKKQDSSAVRALLKRGADVNATQPDGASALHWAAYWDDHDTADLLIRAGARVNAQNALGATPLWVSCTHASATMIARLLKAGADPNAALPGGETPLMTAARAGGADAVKLLLAHGAIVNAEDHARGQTALMWAVAQQHPDVVQLLIDHGANVHARSLTRSVVVNVGADGGDADFNPKEVVEEKRGGFTPLLFATRQGDIESARLLLAAGANVNDAAPTGTSVLVVAAHSGHSALAAFLLEKGADPNAAGAGYTALHIAILRGDLGLVNALLAHGANPNAPLLNATPARRLGQDLAMHRAWVGATPFWLAAKLVDVSMMRAMATSGADPRLASKDGTTPVMAPMAAGGPRRVRPPGAGDPSNAERNILEAVKVAVELGGDVNAANVVGNTALHTAASRRLNTVVQFLADSGAKLEVKNTRDQTPLAMATAGTERRRLDDGTQPAEQAAAKRTADLLRRLGARE